MQLSLRSKSERAGALAAPGLRICMRLEAAQPRDPCPVIELTSQAGMDHRRHCVNAVQMCWCSYRCLQHQLQHHVSPAPSGALALLRHLSAQLSPYSARCSQAAGQCRTCATAVALLMHTLSHWYLLSAGQSVAKQESFLMGLRPQTTLSGSATQVVPRKALVWPGWHGHAPACGGADGTSLGLAQS